MKTQTTHIHEITITLDEKDAQAIHDALTKRPDDVNFSYYRNQPQGMHGREHRGRPVGRFFTVQDGQVVFQPKGTSVFRPGWLGNTQRLPKWDPGILHNTLDRWCCETCWELAAGVLDLNLEISQAPRPPEEAYIYPTCFADHGFLCLGVGEDRDAPPVFGLCPAPAPANHERRAV